MKRAALALLALILGSFSGVGLIRVWQWHDAQALALLHEQRRNADQAQEIEWLKEDLASVREAQQGTATLAVACTSTIYHLRVRLQRLERAYPVEGR